MSSMLTTNIQMFEGGNVQTTSGLLVCLLYLMSSKDNRVGYDNCPLCLYVLKRLLKVSH